MSLGLWVISYLVLLALWGWILFLRGAEFLEGSFLADFFDWFSWKMDAEAIKLVTWIMLIVTTIWFVVGVFVPTARFWF